MVSKQQCKLWIQWKTSAGNTYLIIYGKPAVNKQGFFGHGVLSRLYSLLVFTLTVHQKRIHNLHLRILLSFENNRACWKGLEASYVFLNSKNLPYILYILDFHGAQTSRQELCTNWPPICCYGLLVLLATLIFMRFYFWITFQFRGGKILEPPSKNAHDENHRALHNMIEIRWSLKNG